MSEADQIPIADKLAIIFDDTQRLDVHRAQLVYAWNWFDFHARQRTTMIYYFILAAGAIIAGYGNFVRTNPLAAAIFAFGGLLVSILFFFLDKRNSQLVELGERVLRHIEYNFLFKGSVAGNQGSFESAEPPGILYREKYFLNFPEHFKRVDSKRVYPVTDRHGHGRWRYGAFGLVLPLQHGFWLPFFISVLGVLFIAALVVAVFQTIAGYQI